MSNPEVPDNDAHEPDPLLEGGDDAPAVGVEVPEADALEQAQAVGGTGGRSYGTGDRSAEVPEADALEQEREVGLDEDEVR